MRNSRVSFELTDKYVNEIPYAESSLARREIRDARFPGLVLRVGKLSKTYYLVSAVQGKMTKVKLGRVPELSVERVRLLASKTLQARARARTKILVRNSSAIFRTDSVEMLTTKEAAEILKLSVAWFERKRWEGLGPPYYKIGRSVRYVKAELLSWGLECRKSFDRNVIEETVTRL